MSDQANTLVYFIGGLSDTSDPGKHPFKYLYNHIHTTLQKQDIHGKSQRLFETRLHDYRQSLCTPLPPRQQFACAIPLFTDQSAEDLANQLDEDIERAQRETDAKKIILVAYSSGSALVRRALFQAKEREWERRKLEAVRKTMIHDYPNQADNTRPIPSRSWAALLEKVIHIGGMTVGWEFNSQMPKHYLWLGPIIRPLCPNWFVWQIYRGSKFITDTRIGLNRHPIRNKHQTYYILGTQDQFLSPRDAVEPGSLQEQKNNPIYLEIQGFDHNTILNFTESRLNHILNDIINCNRGGESIALSLANQYHIKHIIKSDIDDYVDPMDNEPAMKIKSVKHVIIVLHGIRDDGFWAKRIAHRIKEQNRKIKFNELYGSESPPAVVINKTAMEKAAEELRVVSLSYGYFSLWDFLRPGGRRQAVEWFQNVYADITALYPNAEVSFVGHSNGTYLGTHALQCEHLDYRYLVLAGSVVRRDFWDTKGKEWQWKKKVGRLLNLQGVDDWIVGLLPGGLESIPIAGKWMDLGGC